MTVLVRVPTGNMTHKLGYFEEGLGTNRLFPKMWVGDGETSPILTEHRASSSRALTIPGPEEGKGLLYSERREHLALTERVTFCLGQASLVQPTGSE